MAVEESFYSPLVSNRERRENWVCTIEVSLKEVATGYFLVNLIKWADVMKAHG